MLRRQIFFQEENKWLLFLISLAVLVNFSGLFIPLMDPDAGVYASISKNMVLRNNYLELYFQGKDWLDKPHFPFWITAIFFKVLGIHTWTYKLPGILFVMLGARYTYLFCKQFYNKTIALWAVFILLTAEHIIISNNDVRAEPFLTGLIIAAIYHFSNAFSKKLSWHLLIASFFSACAVMTKGPFTLIPIGAAIAGELIIKRNWKELFHWRWLVVAALILLFITPELYSLWVQFDKHPEKIVFERTGVSGIRFFLWDSQFGRFFNTGDIKGKGDVFFFLHTLLWAFLPWSLLMYAALVQKIRDRKKTITYSVNSPDRRGEWFTFMGSVFTLLVFSLSRFQLPYYSNIIFPLLAILTAQFIWQVQQSGKKVFSIIQNILAGLLIAGGIALEIFYAPAITSPVFVLVIGMILFLFVTLPFWLKVNRTVLAFYRTGLAALALNFFLNGLFYPDLMKYQSSDQAAFYINDKYPGSPGVCMGIYAPAFEFYLNSGLIKADTNAVKMPGTAKAGIWYVTEDELAFIKKSSVPYEIVKELTEFHVTMLSIKFINQKTRSGELKRYFLVKLL